MDCIYAIFGFKFEIRISKSETNSKLKCSNIPNRTVLNLEFMTFEFVSRFGFRALDLESRKLVSDGMFLSQSLKGGFI